jgi:lipid-A-disaccharide synthase
VPLRVGLVAGESSGDLLAAGLIDAIRARDPDAVFEGVAGPKMIAAGCEAWAEAESLAVMGLIEPLKHLPELIGLRRSLIRRWRQTPPDVFVGVDAPDFNLGLEIALRKSGVRTMHYVSPSVWAWRKWRIRKIRKAADCVLCILPFEPAVYADQGIQAVFVGHPRATSLSADMDIGSARGSMQLPADTPVIAVLPGSRGSEVTRLGPVFAAAAARIAASTEGVRFVTPVASAQLRPLIERCLRDAGIMDRFTLVDGDSERTMVASDVVMLASGTAALESALLCKPTVAAYRVAALTYSILYWFKLIDVPHFTLPNLLTEKPVVPEFIQGDATPDAIADEVIAMLNDPERCADIRATFAKLKSELALDANERAADALFSLVAQE